MQKVQQLAFVVSVSFLLSPLTTMACSCIYGGVFAEYSTAAETIVRATITGYGPELSSIDNYYETMRVEVNDVIKGDLSQKVITIYGDTGMSCLSYITAEKYPLGSEHLIALPDNSDFQPLGAPIPPKGCGEASVRVNGDQVEGVDLLNRGAYFYELGEFIELLTE